MRKSDNSWLLQGYKSLQFLVLLPKVSQIVHGRWTDYMQKKKKEKSGRPQIMLQ